MVIGAKVSSQNSRDPLFKNVLAVDDDPVNLEVLNYVLSRGNYNVVNAEDGAEALDYLETHPNEIDVVLLDKMMPKVNGIDFLKKVKADPDLCHMPVIMQTAAIEPDKMIEGIEAGAYYYLTKPFDHDMLLSIVGAAIRENIQRITLSKQLQRTKQALGLIKGTHYEYRSLEDVRTLAPILSSYFPDPGRVIVGFSELMTNAIEHGNLGIGYQTKQQLLNENRWLEEVAHRAELPENKNKTVDVYVHKDSEKIQVTIRDKGKGFQWSNYMDFDPLRMTDPNGRGIAKANIMAFDKLEYKAPGNEVTCTVFLKKTK